MRTSAYLVSNANNAQGIHIARFERGSAMAMSRNARRKLAAERRKAKALRIYNAAEAKRLDKVRSIVQRNMNAPRERNYYRGLTQDYSSFESASVSPRKHCEAKQKVTCFGKDVNCIPKR